MITVEQQDLFDDDRKIVFTPLFDPKSKVSLSRNDPNFEKQFWAIISTITAETCQKMYNFQYNKVKHSHIMRMTKVLEMNFNFCQNSINALNRASTFKTYCYDAHQIIINLERIAPPRDSKYYISFNQKINSLRSFLRDENLMQIRTIEHDMYRQPELSILK